MLCAVSLGVGAQTTFNVDMTCVPEFDNVFVTGPWCGWCVNEPSNTMTDPDGDGIYTVTLDNILTGEDLGGGTVLIEYKYAINGFAKQEYLVDDMIDGAACAPITDYANYANRQIVQGSVANDSYGTCDGACNDYGCTDDAACNFDFGAFTSGLDDGTCDYSCLGCLDPTAANYNPESTVHNGDCVYCEPGTFILTVDMTDSFGDGWGGAVYGIFGDAGIVDEGSLGSAFIGDGLTAGTDLICLAPGCYSFQTTTGADPAEVSVTLSDQFGTVYGTIGAGETYEIDFLLTGSCGISGCTNTAADNYNISATIDDGSCIVPPMNNEWMNATAIACGLEFDGSLLYALIDEDVEAQYPEEPSVWYEFNADGEYWAVVSTCNSTVQWDENGVFSPTHVEVFTETPNGTGLTRIEAEQLDCSGLHSKYAWYTQTGLNYYIRVSSEMSESFSISADCTSTIEGCTDPLSCTYDTNALLENGSCQICGCTDEQAANFDEMADVDDASCIYLGCTYPGACNYDMSATDDNGSCIYAMEECETCSGQSDGTGVVVLSDIDGDGICDFEEVEGCTDSDACNYLESATDSDASCEYESCLGCLNPLACNYDDNASIDDGSCDFDTCYGCMDFLACNYDSTVTFSNDFCLYLDALEQCGGSCSSDLDADGICDDLLSCENIGAAFWQNVELGVYPTAAIPNASLGYGFQFPVGIDLTEELVLNVPLVFTDDVTGGDFQVLSWSNLTAEGLPPGVELILPQDLEGGSQVCVELTGDDYPTQEGFYEVVIAGEVLLNIFGAPFSIGDVSTSFWIEVVSNPNGVPGCTYPTASNYMPWATYDSGVCEYAGCTDPTALNYSPSNSVDDGSCFYNDPNCVAESACPEDLNGDGAVGTPDLLLMLGEYGNYCD